MHHLHTLSLQDRSTEGTPLSRCDVRVRLVVALAAILAVVMSSRTWFGLLVAAFCLVAMVAWRTPPGALIRRMAGPLVLAAVICLARMLMTGATPLAEFELGPWRLTLTREGLVEGTRIGSRVLGSLGILVLSCHGLSAQELFTALRWARVPGTWIEIAILMDRYIHVLFEQALDVIAAQKVRLGYGTWRRSFHSLGSLAGQVVLRSLEQTEKSHEAMLARGYQGFLPLRPLPSLSRRQRAITGAGVAIVTATYFLAERWPL